MFMFIPGGAVASLLQQLLTALAAQQAGLSPDGTGAGDDKGKGKEKIRHLPPKSDLKTLIQPYILKRIQKC